MNAKNKEILRKIIKYGIFPVEFITALFFTIFVFKIYYTKTYNGYWSLKYLITVSIIGIALLGIIIYNLIKNKDKIETIAISIIIPIGMLYLIFMMPSQVPDELAHLWRAYEITDGKFFSDFNEPTKVPEDLVYKVKNYVSTYNGLIESLKEPTNYDNKIEVNNTAKTYPGFLYIFSALGFELSKLLNLNIILGAYLAKLMNFIIFLVLGYYSIKLIPFGKYPMMAVLFLPMVLHQGTSVSADAIINSLSLLYIAFSVKLIFKKTEISIFEIINIIIMSCLIGISKYVYLPLVGIPLILIFSKNLSKKRKIVFLTSCIILSSVVSVGYFVFSNKYPNPHEDYLQEANVNLKEQVKFIINNPNQYLDTIGNTLYQKGETYIYEAVGVKLGWLEINLPMILVTTYIVLLLSSSFIENNELVFSFKQKLYIWLIIIAIIILIITGLYIIWTTVGKDVAEGIQGRYFIPLLLLILLTLCKKNNYVKIKNVRFIYPCLLALLNISAISTIFTFFAK